MPMTNEWSDPSPTWPEVKARFARENEGKSDQDKASYTDVAARLRDEHEHSLALHKTEAKPLPERDMNQPSYDDVRRQVGIAKEAWEQAGRPGKQPTHQQASDELARAGKTLAQEGTVTTASLRREIEADYHEESPARNRALAQIDALEKRGIHRVERLHGQEPYVAIGDTVSREARRERAEEIQATLDAEPEHVVKGGDLDKGRYREPEPSSADWTKAYELRKDRDGSIVYTREGEERIRDDGRTVRVASDAKSIKDAVCLCKEQGVERIDVRATDPGKRQAIMREAIKQRVQIETHRDPKVEDEYRKALVAVQREFAVEKREAEKIKAAEHGHAAKEKNAPEIGD